MTDLLLDLGAGRTRAVTIEHGLRRAIVGGRLAPGSRLPSTRELARELGCARATVVAAYEQLVAEGYLRANPGSGTSVASVAAPAAAAPAPPAAAEPYAGLLPGEPDPSSFPRRAWAASTRAVLTASPDGLFGYGDRRGLAGLREALAAHLARTRAVVTDPARIVVFGGFGSALSTLAATLARLGVDSVAVEDPGLPPLVRTVAAAGPRIVPVPVDGDGLRVTELGSAGAVLCTPAHQYPTGVVLSPARRAALIEWARARDGWIIEDDYDGEFRYDARPVGAMQGLDPERVVYGGTASKSLAPGLGIAWLALPAALVDPVLDTRRDRRDAVSSIEQAALADFLTSGRFDRHLRAQRLHYRRRRDEFVRVLAGGDRWLTITGASAGLHVTAHLRDREELEVIAAAARRSIAVVGLTDHRIGLPAGSGLVLGYGRPPAHGFPHALDQLATVVAAARR